MDITGPAPFQATLTLAGTPAPTSSWQPGQRLDAEVVALLGGGRVSLKIANTVLEAQTAWELTIGQRLTLQVARVQNQLVLRIVSDAPTDNTLANTGRAPATATTAPTFTLTTSPSANWRVGQQLQAVITAQRNEGQVELKIGDKLFEARTDFASSPGQRLTVQVAQSKPNTVLRMIDTSQGADALRSALRTTLPQQLPLQTVFTRLTSLLSAPGTSSDVVNLVKQLMQSLPDAQSIKRGDALKQALENSGQFLEHRLNAGEPSSHINKDLKANFLQLLAALNARSEESSSDVVRHLEAAVARIQMHQLTSLTQEQTPPAWAGEVPLRHGDQVDVLRLQINKDGTGGGGEHGGGWSTWLSLNLKALGPLHAKITLGQYDISTTFWAESDTTAQMVEQHLDHLRQALHGTGLEVKDLHCHQGRPPFLPLEQLPTGLLDITA